MNTHHQNTTAKTPSQYPIFDGHNDVLLALATPERGKDRVFFEESEYGHLDLPRARRGNFAAGFFAIFIPNPDHQEPPNGAADESEFDWVAARRDGTIPLPEPLTFEYAKSQANRRAEILFTLERESDDQLKIVRQVNEIEACLHSENKTLAAILHFEGAEPIAPDLSNLKNWYARGLRSLGLVWSRPNAFAHGVPFHCPASPDRGPGLTTPGKALVEACNQSGIMLDLSHLNEKGFQDVAKLSTKPLVATHSCAHAICPSARNLTDEQLETIKKSNGIVGCNFFIGDVRADGGMSPTEGGLSHQVKQINYLVEKLGIENVGFGSDFDGATMPDELKDAAHYPNLINALQAAGYDDHALKLLTHQNFLRILRATWIK